MNTKQLLENINYIVSKQKSISCGRLKKFMKEINDQYSREESRLQKALAENQSLRESLKNERLRVDEFNKRFMQANSKFNKLQKLAKKKGLVFKK